MKKLYSKSLENIEWLVTGLFIILLPAIFFNNVMDPVLYTRYTALGIWVLVISIILGVKVWKGNFSFKFTKTDTVIFGAGLLFLIVNVLSAFGAINTNEAIFKTLKEFTLMFTFFYLFQMLRNNPKGKDVIIKAIILMTLGFLGIGVVQLLKADFSDFKVATSDYGYWFRQAVAHVKSTLASINPFASFLFLSLAFSIYGAIVYKRIWRLFAIIAILGAFVFIFILASKASWGALGLSFVMIFVLLVLYLFYIVPKKQGKRVGFWGRYFVLLLPFVLFIAGLYAVEKTEIGAVKMVVDKVKQVLDPEKSLNAMYNIDNPSSAQTRTLVWANTIQMARDNPWLGVGPGQWRIVYAKYGIDAFGFEIRNGLKLFQRTHNDFLWILGELGYPGLFLFLIIYIGMLVIAYRNFAQSNDKHVSLLNGLAFSMLIGFILILFISFPRERITHNVVYLSLFALILSLATKDKESASVKKPIALLGLIVFVFIAIFNLRVALDMVKGDKGSVLIKYGTMKDNMPVLARGVRDIGTDSYYTLDPMATPISYYRASLMHRNDNIEAAKREFLKAYKLHPYHLMTITNLGTAYDLTGDKKNAIKCYNEALRISPRFEEALAMLAIVTYNQNKTEEALGYIAKVPYRETNQDRFKTAAITISRKRGIELASQLNIPKLNEWLKDENKVKATFVRFQRGKESFDKILLKEIGK